MKIYVGWDSREDIAYQVCEHSIKRRDPEAEVQALKQNEMRQQGMYTREIDKLATTEFTFTRFLVPHLTTTKVGQYFVIVILYGRYHQEN